MIGIVDYGLGNVAAFLWMFRHLNVPAELVRDAAGITDATHLVLPGVGSFDWAMGLLEQSGLVPTLTSQVVEKRVPLLGVCVGMQMLADGSDEGTRPGLGWVSGRVRKLEEVRTPHMGWNDVEVVSDCGLFEGLADARFYFLHSYVFAPAEDADAATLTDYGGRFASSIRRGHIHGVQFHPEKSHHWGARLLKNFADLPC